MRAKISMFYKLLLLCLCVCSSPFTHSTFLWNYLLMVAILGGRGWQGSFAMQSPNVQVETKVHVVGQAVP